MNYFWAFCVGGAICVIGQLFIDLTGLTPARILTGYVVAGVALSAIGWVCPAGRICRVRRYRAPTGLWSSAGQGRAHRPVGRGRSGHPHRRAHRRCRRHHRQPCVRRSVQPGGKKP